MGVLLLGAALGLPPALQTCTTREDPLLNRLETTCANGTYAISTWDLLLQRWTTTITTLSRGLPGPEVLPPARRSTRP
jgi:hypothetical protein